MLIRITLVISANISLCNSDEYSGDHQGIYLSLLLLGRLLSSWSGSVLYALGITYLDDSVPARDSGFYVGVWFSF